MELKNNYQANGNYKFDNNDKTELNIKNNDIKEKTDVLIKNKSFEDFDELKTPTLSPSNQIIENEFINRKSSITSNESGKYK